MKWPLMLSTVRHGQSAYNILRGIKERDPQYIAFKKAYAKDYTSADARNLAALMAEKYALKTSDYDTPLSEVGWEQAVATGENITTFEHYTRPDIVLVSPYRRTLETLAGMQQGGFDTGPAKIVVDDRIREQEHGLSLLYSDWRIFHVFHPEQKKLHDLMGPYWYQYPQGESTSQVRERIRSVTNTIVREYAGLNVWLITHHLTKLSIRANMERLSPEEFMRLDREEKPINCGVMVYRGNPRRGSEGKLELACYNAKFY